MRFLFVDKILELSPGGVTRGIKYITPDDYYVCYDEGDKLCFIPSLIGETLGQLAAWNAMVTNDFTQRPVAGVVSSATLHRPAYVGETLLLESTIDSLDEAAVRYHSVAYVNNEIVFSIESALGPLLPMEQFISREEVLQQFEEINRPGPFPDNNHTGSFLANTTRHQLPFMDFDRILTSEPGVSLSAEKCITRAAPYFPDHFPKKPVLPLTILLECKLNLVKQFLKIAHFPQIYCLHELRKIKMNEFVYPGDKVICNLHLKEKTENQIVLSFRSEVNGERVCVLEMILKAKV
ncbi:(3R)-hydroxymyristoyl-ACP dehydratase [Legionella adelaidensis]|uniref:(3R)-hydroxymyristoyl-ACP dehydratase n=1 Tax=Legionella adelaidensis TaxID=45056 RepID=A0A0W0R2N0_9GAMM|nr:hydroxymyristoyl-ACP dehydratase [Legionella adelaidensis]KTC65241.1 (3R)-hydroxymyristoyl-ACP dehydratase [Legionella adelaidensis]